MAMGGRNNYVRLRRWCSTLTRRVVAGGTRRENAGQGIRSRAGEGVIERTGTQKRQSREVLQCCEIRPASGWPSLELAEVWRHLELIYLLIVRDTKVRYKQSLVGIGWALLQPLLTVIVFTVLFDHLVKVPTEGVPYPIFALTALVPWTYFVHALTKTTICLVTNTALITRVYFPRLVLPISAVLAVDAHHHHRAPSALSLDRVRCIGVSVAASWTGETIAALLGRLIAVMGRPAAYLTQK